MVFRKAGVPRKGEPKGEGVVSGEEEERGLRLREETVRMVMEEVGKRV